MSRAGRHVVVTGGMGFVGSHLAEALVAGGDSVSVVDDLSTGRREHVAALEGHPRFRALVADVRDREARTLIASGCDLVVHLAATVGVRRVVERPVETVVNNVDGTAAVLESARSAGATVIVASSSEVYGRSPATPFGEDDDVVLGPSTHPRWGYAVSKLADEFLALGYWRDHGVPVVIARLFNAAGPRQSDHYVLPRFARAALTGATLEVHGDGSQTRCFTHVDDVVSALLAIGACDGAIGRVLNVGAVEEVTVLQLAHRVLREVGVTAVDERCVMVPYAEAYGADFDDMARRVPDISRIADVVGWSPRHGLDQVVRAVVDDQARRLHPGERAGSGAGDPSGRERRPVA